MTRKPPASKQRAKRIPAGHAGASREEKRRGLRPEPRENASVEDPLRDWPDDD